MQKTFIIALAMLAGTTACKAQEKATLAANITGLKDSLVVLYYKTASGEHKDTVPVKDGHFTWTGNVPEPAKVFMMTKTGYAEFYVENKKMTLQGTADKLDELHMTGSPVQAESEAFDKRMKPLEDQQMPLYQEYAKVKGDDEATAKIDDQIDEFRKKTRAMRAAYIRTNPDSWLSLGMVTAMSDMGSFASVKEAYEMISPAKRNSWTGKQVAERMAVLKRSAIGEKMKDFAQADTEGKEFSSSQLRGKYVLVDFWASWCGPCRAENPNVLKAYNAYKDKNFTVLGVSLDDKADRWKKAIQEDGMPWQQVSDLKGWKNEVSEYYGIRGIPSNFLIDPNGVIVAKDLRGIALHRKLAEVIK